MAAPTTVSVGIVDPSGERVTAIGTIGAGGIFNAGFLQAIADERSVSEALAAGVALASRAISTSPRQIA